MRRSNSFTSSAARAAAAVLGVVCVAGIATGCDTVAELSIEQRDFTRLASSGAVNALQCEIDQTDSEFVLTFTPLDADGFVVAPGQVVNSQVLELGAGEAQFGDDDVRFLNPILYPTPDVPCTGDGDCTEPFTCQPLNPAGQNQQVLGCGLPVQVETLQRGLVYDEGSADRYVALLIANGLRLNGLAPDGSFDQTRAIDPDNDRIAAAQLFVTGYGRTAVAEDTELCVVEFAGEDTAGVRFLPTAGNCLTDDLSTIRNTLSPLGNLEDRRGNNIWSAIQETINGSPDTGGFPGLANLDGDRAIVVFTDGSDDSSVTADFDSVLAAVTANSVSVHIVHLDNPPEGEGREGPVDEFARLACQSGGSYQYATAPDDLANYYDVLSDVLPSSYEVEGQLITLADPDVDLEEGCYRLSTGLQVTLAGQQITTQFSGARTYTTTQSIIDDRLVVCKRPVPVPNDNENGDGGGGGGAE